MKKFLMVLLIGFVFAVSANAQTIFVDNDFVQMVVVSCSDSLNMIFYYWPDSTATDSLVVAFPPADYDTLYFTSFANMDMYDIEGIYQGTTPPFVPYELYFQAFRYVPEVGQYYYGTSTEMLRFEVTVQPIEVVTIDSVLVD